MKTEACPAKNSELNELFNKYGTDKDRNGYAGLYYGILRTQRNDVLKVLEIGIGTMIPGVQSSMVGYSLPGYKPGGSLRAWRDWFPNAEIHGIDIQPDCMFTEERITTHLCDTGDTGAVLKIIKEIDNPKFDLIVDDGLHSPESQLSVLLNFWPCVRSGGIYVVEDISRV